MSEDAMKRIESILGQATSLPAEKRAELSGLLAELQSELAQLRAKDEEQARSVAGFTEIATHEATRAEMNPALIDHATAGLKSSIEELEGEHPGLVRIVNQFCLTLSNMGL